MRHSDATISLAAYRAMVQTLLSYVPVAQRENARAAALAVGIGYAYPAREASENTPAKTQISDGTT